MQFAHQILLLLLDSLMFAHQSTLLQVIVVVSIAKAFRFGEQTFNFRELLIECFDLVLLNRPLLVFDVKLA